MRILTVARVAALMSLALGVAQATSSGPVALVEDVDGASSGILPMEFVMAGQVIQLAATDRMTVDYLNSCTREVIIGGQVTIGVDQSTVVDGMVEREAVLCDSGTIQLSPELASKSAGFVFRGEEPLAMQGVIVQRRLYGVFPLIELTGGGRLSIKRLDRFEEPIDIQASASDLVAGLFLDLAAAGRPLSRGGTYRAEANDRSIVFRIDASAKAGDAQLLSRLLRF